MTQSRIEQLIRTNSGDVPFSRAAKSRILIGESGGTRLERRFDARDMLELDDARVKNAFYVKLLTTAVDCRVPQQEPFGRRFLADNYTNKVGENLQMTGRTVRNIVTAIRADVALSDAEAIGPSVVRDGFAASVDDFYDRTTFRANEGASVRSVVEAWRQIEDRTIADFYKLLYKKGPRAIASWLTYEVEFLLEYYQTQPNVWSKMDEMLLRATLEGNSYGPIAEIREVSGVLLDESVIDLYRNILLYGKPKKN